MAEVTTRRCDRCTKLEARKTNVVVSDAETNEKVVLTADDYCESCLRVLKNRISKFKDSYKGGGTVEEHEEVAQTV